MFVDFFSRHFTSQCSLRDSIGEGAGHEGNSSSLTAISAIVFSRHTCVGRVYGGGYDASCDNVIGIRAKRYSCIRRFIPGAYRPLDATNSLRPTNRERAASETYEY